MYLCASDLQPPQRLQLKLKQMCSWRKSLQPLLIFQIKAPENKSHFSKESKCSPHIFPLICNNLVYFRHVSKCVLSGLHSNHSSEMSVITISECVCSKNKNKYFHPSYKEPVAEAKPHKSRESETLTLMYLDTYLPFVGAKTKIY